MSPELEHLRDAIREVKDEIQKANHQIVLLRIAVGEQRVKIGFLASFYGLIGGALATGAILIARFFKA